LPGSELKSSRGRNHEPVEGHEDADGVRNRNRPCDHAPRSGPRRKEREGHRRGSRRKGDEGDDEERDDRLQGERIRRDLHRGEHDDRRTAGCERHQRRGERPEDGNRSSRDGPDDGAGPGQDQKRPVHAAEVRTEIARGHRDGPQVRPIHHVPVEREDHGDHHGDPPCAEQCKFRGRRLVDPARRTDESQDARDERDNEDASVPDDSGEVETRHHREGGGPRGDRARRAA